MAMSNLGKFVMGGALLLIARAAWADAAGDYQALFGQDEQAAVAKGVRAAPEFAAKLANAAKSIGAQKELQALLCEKAYEFGVKAPAGYQAAADAMKLLIGMAGDTRAAARQKLLKVDELRFARASKDERKPLGQEMVDLLVAFGDERAEATQAAEAVAFYRRALSLATSVQSDRAQQVVDKIKELAAAQEARKRIADLRARLVREPDNTAVREGLILSYLAELDDPIEAAKLLTPDVNEGLRTYVPLAARKVEMLGEAVCLDLAEWYAATADKLSAPGKGVLLGKAQACCERYLAVHKVEDVGQLKAKMLLAKLDKAMEAAGGGPGKQITLTLAKAVTMKLVRIPAGKFMMGSPETEAGRVSNEGPPHLVTISNSFYMGAYELTQAQYEAVMGKSPAEPKGPDNMVANVTWLDAVAFCKKLSDKTRKTVRLPAEAEWEYACRAGTTTAYSFGNEPGKLGDYAWFDQNADGRTHPTGLKKPNPWGLYDMHGNVWEWCSDWYVDSYLPAGQAGPKANTVDPHGPASGTLRVLRGGSRYRPPAFCRSAARFWYRPDSTDNGIGLRVVVAGD
jgi:formylglycine-generating enzyme required for sulfatase activity